MWVRLFSDTEFKTRSTATLTILDYAWLQKNNNFDPRQCQHAVEARRLYTASEAGRLSGLFVTFTITAVSPPTIYSVGLETCN